MQLAGKGSGGSDGIDFLRIETRDGPVDFADEYLTGGAAEVSDTICAMSAIVATRVGPSDL
jgi:hypothetical protein